MLFRIWLMCIYSLPSLGKGHVVSNGEAYVSESNFFESDFEHSYCGTNHAASPKSKKKYEPDGLFYEHNGVGSEQWSPDGFTKVLNSAALKFGWEFPSKRGEHLFAYVCHGLQT